ncbi:dipeptide epimerase [Phormidium tenue FACHB-1052]|uniref:Dipeptide epimerase n=2 Tax=Phormidium tenue TaxID=126344 RepID=A0A1U7J2V8_9CYAN|nr:dipeptide epimerase [Phormidium tenue]MBD2231825.1 dipeptide epimerase [Phormidium tenue FACHB-1052]OKH46467.1 dipeptide epimerase [Phormidium tenue NIES-30]
MEITCQPFTVHKRVPLTISRGTTAQSTNLWLKLSAEGIEGWGEAAPFSIGTHRQTLDTLQAAIVHLQTTVSPFHPLERQAIEAAVAGSSLPSAIRAALDVALWDWCGKLVGQPIWRLLGLDLGRIQPTSVTVGISSPEAARQRSQDWLQQTSARALKVKLGSPQGIEADQAMFQAVYDQIPAAVSLSVDANGGWGLEEAKQMADWLGDRCVTHLEQPLPVSQDVDLAKLKRDSPLPIFVDESCFNSSDIPRLANLVDGINIKLMKAGGLTEALRMIHTARACGLQVMFGCYSDSSLANGAMAQLSPLADYLDLDSHLNLRDDPFSGLTLADGRLLPSAHPGLGLSYVPQAR